MNHTSENVGHIKSYVLFSDGDHPGFAREIVLYLMTAGLCHGVLEDTADTWLHTQAHDVRGVWGLAEQQPRNGRGHVLRWHELRHDLLRVRAGRHTGFSQSQTDLKFHTAGTDMP